MFRQAVALYDTLEGSVTERALREGRTAREAIEAMLRGNVEVYADPGKPSGCLIVLGATTWTPRNETVREYLSALRRQTHEAIRSRLERGVAEGDVPAHANVGAFAAYFNTVLEGLSIQARDGATREAMMAVVDCVMVTWDAPADPGGTHPTSG